ncbi:MAG: transporter associated domain-containing protein [Bacteroidota bacterium]|nr:transporter associated domain-containing protein [Bacteroidota bacterium]
MPLTSGAIIGMVVVAVLLFCPAMISGSEVAYFSLGPSHISELKEHPSRKETMVLNLLDKPGLLLELKGGFPRMKDVIQCKGIEFTVLAMDKRRIKEVKVFLKNPEQNE